MRRRTFVKSAGLDRFMPFGMFAGQMPLFACLILALLLMFVSAVRPNLFDPARVEVKTRLAPVLTTFSEPFISLSQTLDYLFSLTRLKSEVEKLRVDNKRLEEWYSTAQLLQAENTSLRDLLKVRLDPSLTFVTTRVIGDTGGPYTQTILVGAGTDDGIHKGDVVMAGEGVIGRITSVQTNSATALLITDLSSRVPVRVETSNLQAIMAGTNGRALLLERVAEGSTVKDGARVMTSGIGGVFPPDLPVGTVLNVDNRLELKPYADFGRLLFVRIVRIPQAPVEPVLQKTKDGATP
jgi:rod shape-determining protein MreC